MCLLHIVGRDSETADFVNRFSRRKQLVRYFRFNRNVRRRVKRAGKTWRGEQRVFPTKIDKTDDDYAADRSVRTSHEYR